MKYAKFMALALLAGLAMGSLTTLALAQSNQFERRHPRRAEVLDRNENIQNNINVNKGNLGGHYGQLTAENRAIHQQARAEARANGGHLTKYQQRQLNRKQNQLNRQIQNDKQY